MHAGPRFLLPISALVLASLPIAQGHADPIATFRHDIVGAQLRVSPADLFVPKNIPGSVRVDITSADGTPHPNAAALAQGKYIQAILRGPAFPAYRVLGLPNEPLILPPIALVGDYTLDDVRMIDLASGETRAVGTPSSVEVHVFPEVLVSQVTSRPLSIEEVQARGIVLDASNYSAVEFSVSFQLEGRAFPVKFPVVTPKFAQSTEIIPAAEVEARLVRAQELNDQIAAGVTLPSELQLPGLNLQVRSLNFQPTQPQTEGELAPQAPPIPALVVIPGSVGFLNRFFSVQVYTANAAPSQSALNVHDIQAELILPPGRDGLVGTPDDPLAFARVGPNATVTSKVILRTSGPEQATRLQPGQTGTGEFLIEGRREGLSTFDIKLTGIMDGLAAGETPISGVAAGSVLIRNPKFSVVFSQPSVVRAGEPYTASMTILNTSDVPADLVSVNLRQASLSGVRFAAGQEESIALGTIASGQSKTATYSMVAERTGAITFSNFVSDDGLSGRFNLRMGVDERGVALSSQVIIYPEWVSLLPEALRRAADRVLGQALSVATAASLPPGVRRVELETVRQRVIELSEVAQRIGYGDGASQSYLDLLLDWHGGRRSSLGFDQILRETDAGSDFAAALLGAVPPSAQAPGLGWITARTPDLAGRGETWGFAAASAAGLTASLKLDGAETRPDAQAILESGALGGGTGSLAFLKDPRARTTHPEVIFRVDSGSGGGSVAWVELDGVGSATRVSWSAVSDPLLDVCYHYFPLDNAGTVSVDAGCRNATSGEVSVSSSSIGELAPSLVAAIQDLNPQVGRPFPFCGGPTFDYFGQTRPYSNYGTLLAVLFNKPMPSAPLEADGAFTLDNGSGTNGVTLQPGGRVALVNLRNAVSTQRPRVLQAATSVVDARGHVLGTRTRAITRLADQGVALNGRVLGSTGVPLADIPVTLTINDQRANAFGCTPEDVRVSQVFTDSEGRFTFDFVPAGMGYTLGATDVRGLTAAGAAFLLDTATHGTVDPAEIERLAATPDGARQVLEAFQSGSTSAAIAVAEGVDRAVFSDFVDLGSPRIGSEVPVVLRFRGRGTVRGTVYAADGVTPVAGAAVNLFPDAGSRELGRGLFADGAGRFEFVGVPLGSYSVEATATDRRTRTVAGRLDVPGQEASLSIVLPAVFTPTGTLAGTVYEADGVTPHAFADVFVSIDNAGVIATARADASGTFRVPNVPAGLVNVQALAFDGRRFAEKRAVLVQTGLTANVYLILPDRASVTGRVQLANGLPAEGALVAGGEAIVTTDAAGRFTLTGVPTGRRTISAGLDVDPPRGIDFVRVGSATLDVVPGAANGVVITLSAAGRLRGRVFDAAGTPIPFVRVVIPDLGGGFFWTDASATGFYSFEPFRLGEVRLAATIPALPVTEIPDIGAAVASGSQQQLQAALRGAFTAYASNFATVPVTPTGFGVTTANLLFDGQTVTADIHFLKTGRVSGIVKNHQGVPIGAQVTLVGQKVDNTGTLKIGTLAVVSSDPATGRFQIDGLPVGPYTVYAESPFYAVRASLQGTTTISTPDAANLTLMFPAPLSTGARLTGRVLRDGAPVDAGVRVAIDYGVDYEILTAANGTFDTQIDLPAATYTVRATDVGTGRTGMGLAVITPGQTQPGFVEIALLSVNGGLDITVRAQDNTPAAGAAIVVDRGGTPAAHLTPTADAQGRAALSNLVEGTYYVRACQLVGQTQLCASDSVDVPPSGRVALALTLAGSGSVAGTYFESNGLTPVPFAQVTIGRTAVATTDAQGAFQVAGIPLGTYAVTGFNAVTGRAAIAEARVQAAGQVVRVVLREDPLGDVAGSVYGSDGATLVAGARVTLSPSNPLFAAQTVTTDPTGGFAIPGVPPGSFTLTAYDPATNVQGAAAGSPEMPNAATHLVVDVNLELRATLVVRVLEANGAPAAASVQLGNVTLDTDMLGEVQYTQLALGSTSIRAHANPAARVRSRGETTVTLSAGGRAPDAVVHLRGVGTVRGQLLTSAGTPVSGAEVDLDTLSGEGDHDTALTDSNGRFVFQGIAVAPVRARAVSGGLAASAEGTVAADGATVDLTLRLTPSADLVGTLVRADGFTIVPFTDIVISYDAPSGLSGVVRTRTSSTGAFAFKSVPEGDFTLDASVPAYDGLVHFRGVLAPLAGTVDLGAVALDEGRPTVASVSPEDNATAVPGAAAIRVTFSRAMDATFSDPNGAYLVDGTGTPVPTAITWQFVSGEPRVLVLTPAAALASLTTYTVVVLGDAQPALTIPAGPGDRAAGRNMAVAFLSRFTTTDTTPPEVLSFTPEDQAVQVDPSSVVRLTFTKPLDPATLVLTLVDGAGHTVPSTITTAVNDQLVVLAPTTPFAINGTYTVTLAHAADRFGNLLPATPRVHTFATLDTVGPTIASLAPVVVTTLASGTQVTFAATLASPEAAPQLQATADLATYALSTPGSLQVTLTMPAAGPAVIRARAIDRFGNFGPFFDRPVTIVPNAPPSVAIVKTQPAGAIRTGQPYRIEVDATATSQLVELSATLAGAGLDQTLTRNLSPVIFSGTIPATLGAGNSLTVSATARDNGGLTTSAGPTTFAIADGVAPVVMTAAASAEVRPGSTLDLDVVADDAFGVAAYTVTVSGAMTYTDTQPIAGAPAHAAFTLHIAVPMSATSGGAVHVVVSAADAAANAGLAEFDLTVADIVPPTVTSVSPPDGATGVALNTAVSVTFSKPVFGVNGSTFTLAPQGGSPLSASVVVASDGRSASLTPDAPLSSNTTYEVALTSAITDGANNPLANTLSLFRTLIVNTTGPRLVAIRPVPTSTNVALSTAIEFEFEAPIDPVSVDPADFALTRTGFATPIAVTLSFLDGGRILKFQPLSPLQPGRGYTATLLGSPRDVDGNLARGLDGNSWVGATTTFTTAAVDVVTYVGLYPSVRRAVEGHGLRATLVPQPALRLQRAIFTLDGFELGTSGGFTPEWLISAPALGGAASAVLRLDVDVDVESAGRFTLDPVFITVYAAAQDFDGDGASNGAEATAGTDPFVADAGEDPDADNLTNGQEIALGTDPHNADTDGDGIPDGDDLEPLVGNRAPAVFLADPSESGGSASFDPAAGSVFTTTLEQAAPLTFELWVYPTSTGPIFGDLNGDAALSLALDATQQFTATLHTSGVAASLTAPNPETLFALHHVAVTYDGARARLFVDGRLVAATPASGTLDYGTGGLALSPTFSGAIDEVRVWSYARTSSEIGAFMHKKLFGEVPGLVADWGFDQSGDLGADATGHGHTAVVTAGALSDGPVYSDRVVQLAGSGLALSFGTIDHDGLPVALAVTRLPQHGTLRTADNILLVAPGPFAGSLTYESEPGYAGVDQLEVVATAGSLASVPLRIQLLTPPARTFVGSDATSPNAWGAVDNWSPVGVPVSTDQVVIPAGAYHVVLDADATVVGLFVGTGSTLSLDAPLDGSANLTVEGHAIAEGSVDGSGLVILSGSNPRALRGHFGGVRVQSDVRVSGAVTVAGNLEILTTRFRLDGQSVTVAGALDVVGGALVMSRAEDQLAVQGAVTFAGLIQSTLTAGTLRAHGRFAVNDAGVFSAAGTHNAELVGPTATVHMEYASTAEGANHFQNLAVRSPDFIVEAPASAGYPWFAVRGDLTLGSATVMTTLSAGGPLEIGGNLTVTSGSWLSSTGLTVGGRVDVASAGTVSVSGPASLGRIGDVTGHLSMDQLTLTTPVGLGDVFDWTPDATHTSFGSLSIQREVVLHAPLAVAGDLEIPLFGSLILNGYAVTVGGALRMSGGALVMAEDGELVDVQGPITWSSFGQAGLTSALQAGVLRGHDSFSAINDFGAVFSPIGTHTTELVGPSTVIHMDIALSTLTHFQNLRVTSPTALVDVPSFSADPVRFLVATGDMVLGNGAVTSVMSSDGTIEIGGDLTVASGRLTAPELIVGKRLTVAAGSEVTVSGTLSVGELGVLAGTVSSAGPLRLTEDVDVPIFDWTPDPAHLSFPELTLARSVALHGPLAVPGLLVLKAGGRLILDGQAVSTGSLKVEGGTLEMTDAGDLIDVAGEITFANGPTSVMSAGLLRTQGAFTVTAGFGQFRPSGTHTVELAGPASSLQVDLARLDGNAFQDLVLNGALTTLFAQPDPSFAALAVSGTLRIEGTAGQPATFMTSERVDVGALVLGAYCQVEGSDNIHFGSCTQDPTAVVTGFVCQ